VLVRVVQVKERDGCHVLSLGQFTMAASDLSPLHRPATAKHLPTGGIGLSFQNYKHPRRVIPATISVLLVTGCAYLVRYRFRDPEIKTTAQAEHSTTGMVARRAGAKLSPTQPKLSVEPATPKTEQPADHPAPELAPR
jgi:hypothetical protein